MNISFKLANIIQINACFEQTSIAVVVEGMYFISIVRTIKVCSLSFMKKKYSASKQSSFENSLRN